MSDKVYVGNKMASFRDNGAYEPYSRVTYWYDDEHYYTAGDDTGRELVANCRGATQEMVDKIYARLKGFVYRPFEATGVDIDPAVEPGDAVTIGGIYSFIGRLDINYDAMCNINIGAPGEREVLHETPWVDPVTRELKRRAKLGQRYQGVCIDRKNGLTIVEVQEDGGEGAKVILNSKELSFYDAGNNRVLYFDPTSGTYKFLGELNVNDKFVVDKYGNVKMAGNLNLAAGTIYWGDNPPNKKRYAASTDGPWHDTMQSGDIYCCDWNYKTNVWGEPYKFVGTDGKPGTDGSDGSDATVNFANVEAVLRKYYNISATEITGDTVAAPKIYGAELFGANIYAGKGRGSFAMMDEDGFKVFVDGIPEPKIQLVKYAPTGDAMQLILGAGTGVGNRGKLLLTKVQNTAEITYVGTGGGEAGFQFQNDGTITVKGELEGVHAVFS